ncbi:12S rRNA N4-methylcytidine (m4C) methyltransferase isoform X2 [Rousettus aegyptiacus]|uniref:12S rRNA N4-methylcytidine (m4C) methyltransferase isoform X2 n=1 Tax=Rousettus aegyptiacus TaxID=9407 RepID=UPI00168D5304|nr:12S rRNA N4-methylcytidine (m4C) methyltransferase isoform X2 [Rousettus aegyptiacus]
MVESYSSTAHPTPARNTSWKPQRLQEPLAEGGWKRRNERQAFLGCWGGLGPNLSVLSSFPQGRDQGVQQVQVLRHRSGCRRPKLVGQLRNLRASDLLTYRMLRYPYFCRTYKEFLSCWLEAGIFNLGVWPKKIHATAERYDEYETQEQTDQTGAQELHRSQDRDFEAMAKLHIPVMVDEVVRCLAPQKGQIFLDMTFGSGGHTRAILQKESDITLYVLDRDPKAHVIAEQLSELYPKQIRAILGQFSQAEALLMKAGVQPETLDGVLLDLGCSSMQLDAPERGFSLRKDGPLDMRMDGDRYPDMPTAADVVNALDQQALASILRGYGEEKHAKKIASAIVQARSVYPITRTQQLASIVAESFKFMDHIIFVLDSTALGDKHGEGIALPLIHHRAPSFIAWKAFGSYFYKVNIWNKENTHI